MQDKAEQIKQYYFIWKNVRPEKQKCSVAMPCFLKLFYSKLSQAKTDIWVESSGTALRGESDSIKPCLWLAH